MAFYSGYVTLPINTYLAWKNAVAGNGYNADGAYGCQCWDLTAEFWHNIGFPAGYPLTGSNHYASECWTVNRNNNISYNGTTYFSLVENLADVKQGDVVVFNGTTNYPTGHIGFADENYDGTTTIAILGQNQGSGGTPPAVPDPAGGTTANVQRLSTSTFLGAFRYTGWGGGPTPPPAPTYKSHFPWQIYARLLNNRRIIYD